MSHRDPRMASRKMRLDLGHATDVSGCDQICLCADNVFRLLASKGVCDLGLINVVGTCRPTTQMSIGDFSKIHPWYRLQKGPGLLTHILCIGQMAGIVIRNSQFSPRVWNGFQISELRQVN